MAKSKGLDGLMSLAPADRAEFLEKVTEGDQPRFKVTQPGDPTRMRNLKAVLPNIATAHKVTDLVDLHDVRMILTRSESYEMRDHLLMVEMDLSGGG